MKKGLQLSVQKVTWAGTQCSDFFPKQGLYFANSSIWSQSLRNYVLNILINLRRATAWKSVIADMPLSAVYNNQKMAVIRIILTADRLGPN